LATLTLGVVAALGACNKGDRAPDTTMGMMTRTDSALMGNTDTTRMLSDDQIFADLTAANEGEVAAGKMAADKASSAGVKSFAKEMVSAHTKMQADGEALAKKLNVTPKPQADDSFLAANDSATNRLQSAASGAAFDTAYVNTQVAGHQMVLNFLRRAASQATAPELKQMLTDAQPVVQHHLDMATALQDSLSQ
jgi:putative membrane protein